MSDVVWSAKADPELRDRLQTLVEGSGLTNKDFLARLVASYEATQGKEGMAPAEQQEIQDLEYHLERIKQTYVHLLQTGKDKQEADAIRIAQAGEEATHAKAAALDARNDATAMVEAAQAAAARAGEQAEAAQAEVAQALEQARKEVADMQDALARARDAQQQSARLAVLAEEAATAAKTRCADLEGMASRAEEYQRDAERALAEAQKAGDALARMIEDARLDKERSSERAELDRERAVLAARQEAMTEIGALREALATAREAKAELEIHMVKMGEEFPR